MALAEPTLRQLQYLVAVAEHGTFGSAAKALHMAQPSLSAQVAAAERRLGVTVFERGRQGASVTPEGRGVIEAARHVLDAARELMRVAAERDGDVVGELTIGVIPTIAPYLLPVIAREVRRRYPVAELILREERTADLVASLRSGAVDLGVLAAPVPELDGSLEIGELASEPFVLAVPEQEDEPHGSADLAVAGSAQTLEELTDLPMLLLEDGHCLREHAASACDVLGVRTFGTVQANGLASLTQMVAAGMGATLLPASAIDVETRPGSGLRVHRLAPPVPTRTIVAAWRPAAARRHHYRVLAEALAEPVAEATALAD